MNTQIKKTKEEIYKQSVIFTADLVILYGGISYGLASKKMRELKNQQDKLNIRGRILTEDYFEALNKLADLRKKSEVA